MDLLFDLICDGALTLGEANNYSPWEIRRLYEFGVKHKARQMQDKRFVFWADGKEFKSEMKRRGLK